MASNNREIVAQPRGGLSLTWSLHEPIKSLVLVSRGILQAATTDNVQPIALLAAEEFGNTLPMCDNSRNIVEKAAGKVHRSAVLEFLQAEVGWSKNDSATYLSRSDAGLRFLGLVAALSTMGSAFEAAKCLQVLIRNSKSKTEKSLPTNGQLQALVAALAPKLTLACFAENVVDAEILLFTSVATADNCSARLTADTTHPANEHLVYLVESLRKLERIGEIKDETSYEDYLMVITTSNSHAWIYAFIEWVLGLPPRIVDTDGQLLNPMQEVCRVVLVLGLEPQMRTSVETNTSFKIEVLDNIGHVTDLWQSSAGTHRWQGFVSLAIFGRHYLYPYLTSKPKCNAIFQGVSCLLQAFYEQAVLPGFTDDLAEFRNFGCTATPARYNIAAALKIMLGSDVTTLPASRPNVTSLWDLPLLKTELIILRGTCHCAHCNFMVPLYDDTCLCKDIRDRIIGFAAKILGASVFEIWTHETMQVNINAIHKAGEYCNLFDILTAFSDDLTSNPRIDSRYLVKAAYDLVDMSLVGGVNEILAASGHGQVLHCSFLSSNITRRTFFHHLQIFSGKLRYKDEFRSMVLGSDVNIRPLLKYEEPVDRPLNLFQERILSWHVSDKQDHLGLVLGLHPKHGAPSGVDQDFFLANPACYLRAAEKLLWLGSCRHSKDSHLLEPDAFAKFVTLDANDHHPATDEEATGGFVHIVASDGNPQHRFWAITVAGESQRWTVVRDKACIDCSLAFCRRVNSKLLIL